MIQHYCFFQIAGELHFNDIILWPYAETLPSGKALHFMLHVIYPRQRILVTLDSDRGSRTNSATRLVKSILSETDKLRYPITPASMERVWKSTIINCPKQQR